MVGAKRFTVTIQPYTIDRLREIAADFGYVSRTGNTKGLGNCSALLDAIGGGQLSVNRVISPERVAAESERRLERLRRWATRAELLDDPSEIRLARAAVSMAEASAAMDRAEDRDTPEGRDAWLAYVRAQAEHGAALLAIETARAARESQGQLDLGPDDAK